VKRGSGLLLLALVLAVPAPAVAQRVVHRVRLGETLADIARHYYGTDAPAAVLAMANGLEPAARPRTGDALRVPTAWNFTLRRSASLEELSRQLLGDRRRWQALVAFNNLGRKRRLKAGRSITVPFAISYLASSGDTYAELASRFLGSPRHGPVIAAYNFTPTASKPPPGTSIEIPIGHVRIAPLRMEELVNERLLGLAGGPERERREALQEANALLRSGEYWGVPLRLLRLLAREIGSDEYIAEVYKLLAIAYVAVDREDLAVRTFHEALLRQPTLNLDQVSTSPKVLRAFIDAKSRLQRISP
jgi:hypothetical protein